MRTIRNRRVRPCWRGSVRAAAVMTALMFVSLPIQAQWVPSDIEYRSYALHTGTNNNAASTDWMVLTNVITAVGDASKFRIHFSSVQLGQDSFIRLTSLGDDGQQQLDSVSMGYWQNTSAIFNGHQVRFELHVAPGDTGVFAEIDLLLVECDCPPKILNVSASGAPETLCGADSRVASGDNRVGRISGCTAWLVSNGAVLTAGHCGSGGGVFEVNIPASSASGGQVASAPQDQYPIDTSSRIAVNNGKGDDYGVFALLPNTSTGGRAHLQHGFFRMTRNSPSGGSTIRITGCGVDNSPAGPVANCCATDSGGNCTHPNCNAQSRTLQTSTGSYVGETGSGSDIYHSYQTDTEPANSGSPIIWNTTGFTIGIHTHGGCSSGGGGDNDGTSFENNGLENILQNFPGSNTEYVDAVTYPNSPTENGAIFQPYNTVTEGVIAVPSGGRVAIVEGTYTAAAGNTLTMGADGKAFTVLAPVGTVHIGN